MTVFPTGVGVNREYETSARSTKGVFPTGVGVNPYDPMYRHEAIRFPHRRGGEPYMTSSSES